MVMFKAGQKVRQVMPKPIEGTIVRFIFDENTGTVSYVVESIDEDGVAHQRSFVATDLEAAV